VAEPRETDDADAIEVAAAQRLLGRRHVRVRLGHEHVVGRVVDAAVARRPSTSQLSMSFALPTGKRRCALVLALE
jgi:hypothetical protein